MALMKSGWLWRQSSILKRWKMNWCDLWIDGSLMFYKTESRRNHESRIRLKIQSVDVKAGLECMGVIPPEGHPKENLVVVVLRDRSSIVMCASSEDESLAWKLTMMEAKRNTVYMYNPYDDGYQYVSVDSHNAVYINPDYANGGIHHILVHQQRRDGIGEQVALGLLAGMATGAAMRSFLCMPFWFC
ncbi:pleckstrin homology domain-containing family B member 1 [Paramormyrops kingsleyae]|uniref:Pleckstrin homology domain containing B1 n=1 Tax=Paramormyrops kingsleyae TaxID=1676925 RepID=A0A3B3QSY5_9TELE|nr:pleckstrin homology domain-containing family B member 1 [Paramormyrops kingsleyae]